MPFRPHFLLLIAALLSMACAAHAQENAYEAGREGRIAVTQQYVDKAKQIIRGNIATTTPNLVALFDQIQVQVVDDQKSYASAYIEAGKRYIKISTGFTILSNLYVTQTFIFRNAKSFNRKQCLSLVEDAIRAMQTLSVEESLQHPSLKPWRYCGVTSLPLDPDQVDRGFNALFDPFHTSVVTTVLAHEYAHHLLGHLPAAPASPEENRRIEHIADRSASYLLGEGGTRVPAAIMFYMLSRYKSPLDPFRNEAKYAASQCRFLFFIRHDQVFAAGIKGKQFDTLLRTTPHFAGVYRGVLKQLSVTPDKIPNCIEILYSDEDLFGVKR
ncbi:MAG: hypothetical protein C0519_16045 [Hyphomicrobium sp.]|nr:hypothetical protein [Hyphomicrobium sp.]